MKQTRLLATAIIATTAVTGCSSIQSPGTALSPNNLPAPAATTKEFKQGVVYRDYWLNVSGESVDALRSDARFPAKPDGFDVLTKLEGPINWGDKYGARVQALVTPPSSGNYTFYIASDDYAELWLSSDAQPGKKQLIASVPGATRIDQWNKYPQQISASIRLEQGKKYYLEVVHKEHLYDDHFRVAWEGPGTSLQVIGGQAIAPYLEGAQSGASSDFVKGYTSGYRVGYDDGKHGFDFAPGYPAKDTDNDGLPDNWEIVMGLDPQNAADALKDNDGDLLSNYDEYVLRLNPLRPDTDGDGLPDGYEVAYGLSPLDPSDASGDLDGDGISNLDEYRAKTDPADPKSIPAVSAKSGLKVEYWRNVKGNAVADLTSLSAYPNSPAESGTLDSFKLPENSADHYGARISGYLVPKTSGQYTFYIASDDQSELYLSTDSSASRKAKIASVTGAVKVGEYTRQATQKSASIRLEAGKAYYIEALYKEGGWDDHLEVAWEGPGITRQVISKDYLQQSASGQTPSNPAPSQPIQLVNGMVGQYFNGTDFNEFVTSRFDKSVNFNWARSAPIANVNVDKFSVRWQGKIQPTHASGSLDYTFYVTADDGFRLWVDNKLLIDRWVDQSPTEHATVYALEAGKFHDIRIEYFENRYDAQISLSWQPKGGSKTTVPSSALYTLDTTSNSSYDGDNDGMADVWELQNGLNIANNDASLVLNSAGITALNAFKSGVNPWTGKGGSNGAPLDPGATTPTLVWTAPTKRVDGTALYPYEIDRYELFYGNSTTSMTKSLTVPGTQNSYSLDGYTNGTYSFSVLAVDTDGLKSSQSNPVTVTIK